MVTLVLTEIELESIMRLYGALVSAANEAGVELDPPVIESIYFKALEAASSLDLT